MGQGDYVLPRLALCQSGTPQRLSGDVKYIEGLAEGDFFNTITRKVFGPTVHIVPILFFKSRLLFRPMDQGGGLICQSFDSFLGVGLPGGDCLKCPLQAFGPDGHRPECNLLHNYVSLVIDQEGNTSPSELAVLALKSTGLTVAKDFNALMRMRRADMYAGIYEVGRARVTNQVKQSWFKPAIKNSPINKGWVTEEALQVAKLAYEAAMALRAEGRLKVDVEDLHPEAGRGEATTEM